MNWGGMGGMIGAGRIGSFDSSDPSGKTVPPTLPHESCLIGVTSVPASKMVVAKCLKII